MNFELDSKFEPKGDQPEAIKKLLQGINNGDKFQTLLGVTGSGKTFTIANVIAALNRPTLVIAHNKTLAAQLCSEYRTFFPKNAVEYFVSYYDYYQPEAYLPATDVYIEKDMEMNQEIERLRHAATQALLSRQDVIVVASVSCIYGLGDPEVYKKSFLSLEVGQQVTQREVAQRLVELYFTRGEILERGKFNLHGLTLEIMPAQEEIIIRLEFDNDKLKKIILFNALTKERLREEKKTVIYPAKHFVVESPRMIEATAQIEKDLDHRLQELESQGKILEAERLRRRTRYDLELMREIGYCSGIENYSRYLTGRKAGDPPYTLLDYFPVSSSRGEPNFLMVIDESHVTVPQLGGMYEGDRSRKENLVEYGFRLPSALDNRPLKFSEFEKKIPQVIFTSATPAKYELQNSRQIVQQIIRPTGLADPELEIRPTENQVKDIIREIEVRAKNNERILVTTLTKKMAEELAEFLKEAGLRAEYLHSDVDTLDRVTILENLRRGKFDALIGVNLLREGLDLPEVTLIAILDADKEGFLRSEVSLIQTIGRAARNVRGKVLLYADNITGSMERAITETNRRRKLQIEYNKRHGITPQTIEKEILSIVDHELAPEVTPEFIDLEKIENLPAVIKNKQKEMKEAARALEFEKAALLRDEISQLRKLQLK